MQGLRNFDFYPKTQDDFRVKTLGGGLISIISLVVIFILVFGELYLYMQVERYDQLYVDTQQERKIPIYINITFPAISCDALSLDVMDVSGEHHVHLDYHTIYKMRLTLDGKPIIDQPAEQISPNEPKDEKPSPIKASEGAVKHDLVNSSEKDRERAEKAKKVKDPNYCGSCYGANRDATQCCNTCDDVREAYRRVGWAFTPNEDIEQCYEEILDRKMKYSKQEGCNLHGYFLVNKVAGNFHFAPGKSFVKAQQHMHDYTNYEIDHYNTSHFIHSLGFGEQIPGLVNPLDGTRKIIGFNPETGQSVEGESALFQYFVKVVPTIYEKYGSSSPIITNQYSVTQHVRPKNRLHPNVVPGVFFIYDLSPIMVHMKEDRKSLIQFLTSLCAIIGGVFTVSALLDRILYGVEKRVNKKIHSNTTILNN
ncbi:hypothetical protein FDP41_011376 [Naegleria fowleri]|uniref:Endoplasmic reticulum vesicle transporter C-terminal domain-containing protein n=1 Tax=Naegleria fowleri TaxID=5763 RepID=A0A6A5C3X2_NAEFO|nr:uncharacterized protein FDP41_011376 [Naegleria fowleri]KAF0982446.1 hypothetical protein FDP41_011376 [Naegleria fowleri]